MLTPDPSDCGNICIYKSSEKTYTWILWMFPPPALPLHPRRVCVEKSYNFTLQDRTKLFDHVINEVPYLNSYIGDHKQLNL